MIPSATRFAFPRRVPRLSAEFGALLHRVLVGLGVFHFVAQLFVWFPMEWARTDHFRDIAVYYDAIQRFAHGGNAYLPWPDYGVQMTPSRFFYSPVFLLLTRPLAGLDYQTFSHVWLCLVFAAFWVYCACLGRLTANRWDWKTTLLYGLVIDTLMEGYTALCLGQFETWMWMLFGLALVSKRSRAGWLAWAALVKIHPVWSLCLALTQDKRAWKSALLFALPVVAASWILAGTRTWLQWWPATQPVASQGTFHFGNWSWSFFVLRLAWCAGLLKASGALPVWAKMWLAGCAVGAPIGMAYLARKLSPELRLALVACAGVLCAPLCWGFYYPLLLLPFAVWRGECNARRAQKTT